MPNANYLRGRRSEHRVKRILEDIGYHVIRAAGSKGVFDLVAIRPDKKLRLVQVKRNCKPSRDEMSKLKQFAVPEWASKEVWIFSDRRRFPQIMEVA